MSPISGISLCQLKSHEIRQLMICKRIVTFERRSSRSFFLKRGFANPFLIASSQISLEARRADGRVMFKDETLGELSILGFAFFGGKLRERSANSSDNIRRWAHFNLGSLTLKPIIIPRGIEPVVCKFPNEAQNLIHR